MASSDTVALSVRDRAELERTIAIYTSQGYAVARQTDDHALLVRQRHARWWTVALAVILGGWGVTGKSDYVDLRVGATVQEAFHPVSEDSKWWWDGKHWVSTARTIPPEAPLSVDRVTWWTGREWRPVPCPISGWRPADYTPGKIPSLAEPAKRVIRSEHFSLLVGLTAAVVLAGLGVIGVVAASPSLAIGCFLIAVVLLARAITSPPAITIDASGIHAKSRLRHFAVAWSMRGNVKADESGALVCFDASGQAWPWHAGKTSEGSALLRAKWFRWDGDYLAAAIDEMSTSFRKP